MSVARACATMDRPRVRALPTRAEACRSEHVMPFARAAQSSHRALAHALADFGFESVDTLRPAAIELESADALCDAAKAMHARVRNARCVPHPVSETC